MKSVQFIAIFHEGIKDFRDTLLQDVLTQVVHIPRPLTKEEKKNIVSASGILNRELYYWAEEVVPSMDKDNAKIAWRAIEYSEEEPLDLDEDAPIGYLVQQEIFGLSAEIQELLSNQVKGHKKETIIQKP